MPSTISAAVGAACCGFKSNGLSCARSNRFATYCARAAGAQGFEQQSPKRIRSHMNRDKSRQANIFPAHSECVAGCENHRPRRGSPAGLLSQPAAPARSPVSSCRRHRRRRSQRELFDRDESRQRRRRGGRVAIRALCSRLLPHSMLGSTRSGGLWLSSKVRILMITFSPISTRPSMVAEPICGSSVTLPAFASRTSFGLTAGSCS